MTVTVTGGPAYGVSWHKTGGNPACTRLASATGLTAGTAFNSLSGGAWGLRRCNLYDGTVTAYYGDRCYTDTDVANMGQAMVEIPKFYYYMEYDAGTTTYYWFVTTNASTTINVGLGVGAQTVKIHPAFTRDTATKNNIYVGAYGGYYNAITEKLESKAGIPPTTTQTLATFRTQAEENGGGYEPMDYLALCATQLLYLIEYGTFYALGALGRGIQEDTAVHNTGESIADGNASHVGSTVNNTTYISYRGIENWYGNLTSAIDGINIGADMHLWVADNGFTSDPTAGFATPYVNTEVVPTSASGWGTDIAYTSTYDYGFAPSATIPANGYNLYLCDKVATDIAGGKAVLFNGGGFGAYWPNCSPFSTTYYLSSFSTGVGARLMYIG